MIKWIARGISTLTVLFFLMMIIGESDFDQGDVGIEGILVVASAVVLALSVIIAWIKPKLGGIILIVCALIFMIFIYITAGTNRILSSLLFSSPFLLSGILFYIHGKTKG
jgi:hypothetical protein